MILYLDTSALVKLYVAEEYSAAVMRLARAAEHLATSVIALPEATAAVGRRQRLGHFHARQAEQLLRRVEADWGHFVRLAVDSEQAAALAWRRALRGMDAVHLAAACVLRDAVGRDNVAFCAFDAELVHAAAAEGLNAVPPPG